MICEFLVDHALAELHHLLAADREQVGIHVDVVDAQLFELPHLFDHQLWRAHAGRELVADVLDAVGTAGRAAAAGDDEGERPFDHRHAVLLQRQQLVQGNRQVVQAGNEGTGQVDDDLAVSAPGQSFDPPQVWTAVFVKGWAIAGIVALENAQDRFRTLLEPALQVIEQVAQGQVGLANQGEVQRRERAQGLARDGGDVGAECHGDSAARFRQEIRRTCRFPGWARSFASGNISAGIRPAGA